MIQYKFIYIFLSLFIVLSCKSDLIQDTQLCTIEDDYPINEEHPKSEEIKQLMDEYISKGLPGMSVLISDNDGMWYASAGFADIENGIAMEPCHINKLGSVTKMMMGTLTWLLIQDDVLSIDDPMSMHIPEVASKIENGDDITLRMLLNHTSGVYDIARDVSFNFAVVNDFSRSWTSEEIIPFFEGKSATGLPGDEVSYSNANTLLVGMIIDAVTGQEHEDLLKSRIYDPLGMTSTIYYDYESDFPSEFLAQGYLDFHNDGGDIQNLSQLNPGSGNGYTGVYSNVLDLHTFINALLKEETLITPENLNLIYESMRFSNSGTWRSSIGAIHDQQRYLFDDDVHAYGHDGGDIAYAANLNYMPHNNTIFAATYNYGTNLPTELSEVLSEFREKLYVLSSE
jgi:D-alanyl-D-alanine carboxypeptidase